MGLDEPGQAEPPPRSWRNIAIAAAAFYGLFGVGGSIVALGYPRPFDAVVYNLVSTLLSMGFALGISLELDRGASPDWRTAWRYIIALAAAAAVASEPMCWLVARAISVGASEHPRLVMLESWIEGFLLYLLWALIHVFVRSSERAIAQERRIAAVRRALLEQENEAIVYALDPDFVTDVLERVRRKIGVADAAAGETVIALAEHMRSALAGREAGRTESPGWLAGAPELDERVEAIGARALARWSAVMWAGLLVVVLCLAAFRSPAGRFVFLAEFAPQPIFGAAWCWLMQQALERRPLRPVKPMYAEATALCLAGYLAGLAILDVSSRAIGRLGKPYGPTALPALEFYYMAPALLAWAAAYFIVDARRREILRLRSAAEVREAALKARNAMLRQQINPHFLFNALNALYALILDRDHDRARGVIEAIRRFLERASDCGADDLVALSSELATQDAYLEVERVRFGDRLQVRRSVDGEVAAAQVPHLILQPLVENAVKYSLARTSEPVLVEIRAGREGDELVLQVRDSGAPGGAPRPQGLGVGLKIVEGRLKTLYGSAGRLACEQLAPQGFLAEVRVPFVV